MVAYSRRWLRLGASSALLGLLHLGNSPVRAQILPDNTLPNNSIVTPNGNILTVEGGTAAGGNLFHSFEEFSLLTGSAAFFNNALTIDNIIARVTGGKRSSIDGLISANGSANLFLLNPAGIVFGPNASLNIGGSFVGSTAESLQLSDGNLYSATNPEAPPLLTINVPTGLQFGANPGRIINQSVAPVGGNFSESSTAGTDNVNGALPVIPVFGLSVNPGQTLALIGGDVRFEGGRAAAPSGRIELGAVGGEAMASLAATNNGFTLGYEGVENFRDVEFSQQANLDVSGAPNGTVRVQGRNVRVIENATINAFNFGAQAGGAIQVKATALVEVVGTGNAAEGLEQLSNSNDNGISSLPGGFYSLSFANGIGGDIEINTGKLSLRNNVFTSTSSSGTGRGGSMIINATDSVEISSAQMIAVSNFESEGDTGDVTINTDRLVLKEGGGIGVNTNGAGRGGIMRIDAQSVEMVGTNLILTEFADGGNGGTTNNILVSNTALTAATVGSGDAGEMRITTERLVVRNGAGILVTSVGQGQPGNAFITATKSVELIGTSPDQFAFPSSIQASAFNPLGNSGEGGNVKIATENLTIRDGASLAVNNVAPGTGGSIEVVAENIRLNDGGSITAETAFGGGGNIRLQARDLQLRDNSQITATAGSAENPLGLTPEQAALFESFAGTGGDGGNIVIETDNLVALDNSDIIANATAGFGGRVNITAQGIFGTQFRETLTPESDITASSDLGAEFSGIVEINTPDAEPAAGLAVLPENVSDPSNRIATGCAGNHGNTFITTGRGGLPPNPNGRLLGQAVWGDVRDLSEFVAGNERSPVSRNQAQRSAPPEKIVEATGWVTDESGQLWLVATSGNSGRQNLRHPECVGQL